jgi:SAM-dependent methyltransferase
MGKDGGYFGEQVAATYDEATAGMFDENVVGPAVGLVAQLASGGSALEFGIGTGRIALPLAQRGVEVLGIDLSRAMPDWFSRIVGRTGTASPLRMRAHGTSRCGGRRHDAFGKRQQMMTVWKREVG